MDMNANACRLVKRCLIHRFRPTQAISAFGISSVLSGVPQLVSPRAECLVVLLAAHDQLIVPESIQERG